MDPRLEERHLGCAYLPRASLGCDLETLTSAPAVAVLTRGVVGVWEGLDLAGAASFGAPHQVASETHCGHVPVCLPMRLMGFGVPCPTRGLHPEGQPCAGSPGLSPCWAVSVWPWGAGEGICAVWIACLEAAACLGLAGQLASVTTAPRWGGSGLRQPLAGT